MDWLIPTTDGYILRQTNDVVLCTDCHTYGTHNGADCLDCHEVHNSPNQNNNIYLIKDSILTLEPVLREVKFTAETGTNSHSDGDGTYDGVCEVCHTTASYHTNTDDGSTHNDEANCTTCHNHSGNFPGCTTCHTANTNFYTDVHDVHVSTYSYECSTCHFGHGYGTATHDDATSDVVFDTANNAIVDRWGLDYADGWIPSYTAATKTCTNVYCHSNGITDQVGVTADYNLGSSTVALPANYINANPQWDVPSSGACGTCHGADNTATSWPTIGNTKAHKKSQHKVVCSWCHSTDGTTNNILGTYNTNLHVDGYIYFDARTYGNGDGTFTADPANNNAVDDAASSEHCGDKNVTWY